MFFGVQTARNGGKRDVFVSNSDLSVRPARRNLEKAFEEAFWV